MRKKFLNQFLNFFWLRPENAILLAIRAAKYKQAMEQYLKLPEKSMDVSCGDGVFSFITAGGKLSQNTDMYRALNLDYERREDDFDTYDYFDDTYFVQIEQRPEFSYAYGTDWKKNLLKKAEELDFYDKFLHHDNNKRIPLKKESLNFIYSNSAYWVENINEHLDDLVRILEPGGTLVLEFKTQKVFEYKSDAYASYMGEKFHKIIDGGRASTWK
jgi:ubiquinone/menaquinone biosynthesis C-methylase UbiE